MNRFEKMAEEFLLSGAYYGHEYMGPWPSDLALLLEKVEEEAMSSIAAYIRRQAGSCDERGWVEQLADDIAAGDWRPKSW